MSIDKDNRYFSNGHIIFINLHTGNSSTRLSDFTLIWLGIYSWGSGSTFIIISVGTGFNVTSWWARKSLRREAFASRVVLDSTLSFPFRFFVCAWMMNTVLNFFRNQFLLAHKEPIGIPILIWMVMSFMNCPFSTWGWWRCMRVKQAQNGRQNMELLLWYIEQKKGRKA